MAAYTTNWVMAATRMPRSSWTNGLICTIPRWELVKVDPLPLLGNNRPAPLRADHHRTCKGAHVRRDCKYG